MAAGSQPEPASSRVPDKDKQDLTNTRLQEEKLRLELIDLRRPYLLRNPQLLTALITSIGAVIGVSLLLGENYFKIREERNNLQAQRTAQLEDKAREASLTAETATKNSENAIRRADLKLQEAAKIEGDATTKRKEADSVIKKSQREIIAVKGRLLANQEQLANLEVEVQARRLAAEAEELFQGRQYRLAREKALQAWKHKQTQATRATLLHAYSYPATILEPPEKRSIDQARFSPDARGVLARFNDGAVALLDAESGQQLIKFESQLAGDAKVRYSPDGMRVIGEDKDRDNAIVWNAQTGRVFGEWKGVSYIPAVFSPDGGRVIIVDEPNGMPSILDLATGKKLLQLRGDVGVHNVAGEFSWALFSPDGKAVLTQQYDGTTRVWNSDNGEHIIKLEGEIAVEHEKHLPVFSPDSKRVLLGTKWGVGTIEGLKLWDLYSGKQLLILEGAFPAQFSPDGRFVIAAGGYHDSDSVVSDSVSGKLLCSLEGTPLAFSPNGDRATTKTKSGWQLWAIPSGEKSIPLRIADDHGELELYYPEFSFDGQRILGTAGTAIIFDISGLSEVEKLHESKSVSHR
jgi:WD40 repeat protein